jgi:hypothetical protein
VLHKRRCCIEDGAGIVVGVGAERKRAGCWGGVLRVLLWEKRISGPASVTFHLTGRHNRGQRLVVCRAGELVVAGGPGRFSLGRRSRWVVLPERSRLFANCSRDSGAPKESFVTNLEN